jgi:hypothetical protein
VLLNKNIKIILNYFLGPLVFLFLFYSIYQQVLRQHNWQQSFHQIKLAISSDQQWKLWIVLLLMPVNWGLEARKWQLSIGELEHIPFSKAFRATLTGVTIASFTPNRIGEYLGRMLYVQEGKRAQSIPLTIICSVAQFIVTMITGWIGIFYLQRYLHVQTLTQQPTIQVLLRISLIGISFVIIIVAIFYFRLSSLVRLLERLRLGKYTTFVKVLKDVKRIVQFNILFLSFGRYVVFILQYFLLFSLFGVALSWGQTFAGVSVMFLVMAVVPTLTFLTDLGLRWEASIQIIQLFNPNTTGIFAVSFGIWLINLIIPALIGSLLILRIKLFRSR